MNIEPFGVEIWMNEWEQKCEFNLAETCVESLTIAELLNLTGASEHGLSNLLPLKMTYGDIKGSDRLRTAIANLYAKQAVENIVVTHGTIGANMLVHKTLVNRGDRVVSIVPTYQQHHSIPASIGADVHQLRLNEQDRWLPDLTQLRTMVTPDTKLIALTNPNNPTGALIPTEMLQDIADIARSVDAWVLCDEVYRGTNQQDPGTGPSMADIYDKGISTAGMSKAFSLAGLRLGWIAASSELIEAVMIHRDYDTISVGQLDDYFAALALEHHQQILSRSREITRENLTYLSRWIEDEPRLSWVPPSAGTTAFVRCDVPQTSREWCLSLLRETGVMFTPGSALGVEGYVRIGFANNHEVLKAGLARVSEHLRQ